MKKIDSKFEVLKTKVNVVLFLVLFVINNPVQAQEKKSSILEVTKVSTFEKKQTFPLSCIKDTFYDSKGKLWITTCNITDNTSSGLYRFDGYKFKPITFHHTKLKNGKVFYEKLQLDRLYGYYYKKSEVYLFYYDISKEKAIIYDALPMPNNGLMSHSFIIDYEEILFPLPIPSTIISQRYDNDKVYSLLFNGQSFTLETYISDSKIKTYPSIKIHNFIDNTQPYAFGQFKHWVILYIIKKKRFVVINLKNGKTTTQDLNTPSPIDLYGFSVKDNLIKLRYNLLNGIKRTKIDYLNVFEIIESEDLQLKFETEIQSSEPRTSDYFRDNSGNSFSYFKKDEQYNAYITDSKKNTHNVTHLEVFSNAYQPVSLKVKSENFLDHILCYNSRTFQFYSFDKDYVEKIATNSPIRFIEQVDENTIVYGNELREIGFFNQKTKELDIKNSNTICKYVNPFNVIKRGDVFWGTRLYSGSLYTTSFKEECTSVFNDVPAYWITFDNENNLIYLDKENNLWQLDLETEKTKQLIFKERPQVNKNFLNMLVDESHFLWICSTEGLYNYNLKTHENKNLTNATDGLDIISMLDNGHELLLGTLSNGLIIFNKQTYEITTINTENGLSHNSVASITKDKHNYYWVATYNGITILDQNYKTIKILREEDGLVHNEANRYSSKLLSNGKLAIGTINGISLIDIEAVIEEINSKKEIFIYMTGLTYYDKEHKKITRTDQLDELNEIILPPENKELIINVALTDYKNPDNNTYFYKLNDQKEWIEIRQSNTLNLYQLPSGKYKLLIKGGDGSGHRSKNTIELSIIAETFFYKKPWFYLLVFFTLFAFALLNIKLLKNKIRLATAKIENDHKIIKQQAEKLQELDKAKTDFFINISHEFRTPLSVISGIVQVIRNKKNYLEKGLHEIEQNSSELLDMVNQILDLRKLESNELKLNMQQYEIVSYVDYILDFCQNLAVQKNIKLKYESTEKELFMDIDAEKLKIILVNLISNALKYTPNGGHVNVKLSKQGNSLLLQVKDNGIGIKKEDQQKIFERYYQAKHPEYISEKGFGIGLSFTEELVKLMKGNISLESELDVGTKVSLQLPITQLQDKVQYNLLKSQTGLKGSTVTIKNIKKTKVDDLQILVVEDNASIRALLCQQLSDYHILLAKDGQEGVDLALKHIPDIIISDVMMPVMNGYEVCNLLKNNKATSHIPIILLTAKADHNSKIEGLKVKADVYLPKPYDVEELKLNISNLLESRRALQHVYRNLQLDSPPTENPKEGMFIKALKTHILQNLKEDNYSIEDICNDLNISRTALHKKIKTLTGQSITKYINQIRLEKAKELMSNSLKNISEISLAVGYKSPEYFSRKFKDEFGISPSEYRENLKG